jgi:hypothetical protein
MKWWVRVVAWRGAVAAATRFALHAAVAAAAVAAPRAVTAGGGGGGGSDGEAGNRDGGSEHQGGVSADAGLFWAPAAVSPAGQAVKAAAAALWFYPACLLRPFGLRVLYLTPRSFRGTVLAEGGEGGEGADSLSSVQPLLVAVGGFSVACGGAAVVAFLAATWLGRAGPPRARAAATTAAAAADSAAVAAASPGDLPAPLGAALGVGCWCALLLPCLGLYGSHGWTLLGADRYVHLPALLVAAPLVAWAVDWGERRLSEEGGGCGDCGDCGDCDEYDDPPGAAAVADVDTTVDAVAAASAVAAAALAAMRAARRRRRRRAPVQHRAVARLACWRLSWGLLCGCGVGSLSFGSLAKWTSSDALWPAAALCRPGLLGAADHSSSTAAASTSSSSSSSLRVGDRGSSWLDLYACSDVIALYNLARRLQAVRPKNRERSARCALECALNTRYAHGLFARTQVHPLFFFSLARFLLAPL